MSKIRAFWISPWALRLALTLIVLGIYARTLRFDFVNYDDNVLLYENSFLKPPSIAHAMYYWTHRGLELYIPITYSAWSIIAALSHSGAGPDFQLLPVGFHAANVLFHLAATMIVFELLKQFLASGSSAFLGAILFAVHPLQVESVAWATGLRDVLGGTLALLAVWLDSRATRRLDHFNAWAIFVIAMLAKPSSMVAIAIIGTIDLLLRGRGFRRTVIRLIPWGAAALVILLIAQNVQPVDVGDRPLWYLRPLIACDAIAFYMWKIIVPFWLTPVYARNPASLLQQGWINWTWLVPAGIAVILVRLRRTHLTTAAFLFVAGVLPTLGFIPFIYQRHSTVADRYVYIAMLGPALGLAWIARSSGRAGKISCGVILIALSLRCANQVGDWTDSLTLFELAVQRCPDSPVALVNYGAALGTHGRLEEADGQFVKALLIEPRYPRALQNHHRYEAFLRFRAAHPAMSLPSGIGQQP